MKKEKKKVIWQTLLSIFQTLSGAFLIFFMSVHLFGNSLMTLGGEGWFNFYTSHLDKTNIFIKSAVYLIAVLTLCHGLNGLRIIFRYLKKPLETTKYVFDTKYRDSFLWYIHSIAGLLILLLVPLHLLTACLTTTSATTTAAMVKEHLQNPYYFYSVIILLAAAIFHMLFGARTILMRYNWLAKYRQKIPAVFYSRPCNVNIGNNYFIYFHTIR